MRNYSLYLLTFLCFIMHSVVAEGEIRLLVRSDDIGSFHAANLACVDSVNNGIARSVEIMVPTPWYTEAVAMLNQNPHIDVGVHLTLTSEWENVKWRPLTGGRSFTDPLGNFLPMTSQRDDFPPNTGFIQCGYAIDEVEAELRAQIEAAKAMLKNVSHLSAHMGTPTCMPDLREVTYKLAEEYNLPIQFPTLKRTPRLEGWSELSLAARETAFITMLKQLTPGTYLFVEHPALDSDEMQTVGHKGYFTVAKDRDLVTQVFTSPRVKEAVQQLGIQLVSYADVIKNP
jgi:chitin disaccharide deacetylase